MNFVVCYYNGGVFICNACLFFFDLIFFVGVYSVYSVGERLFTKVSHQLVTVQNNRGVLCFGLLYFLQQI